MSVIAPGALFPATTVADGIVVAERAQTTGECQQSDSSAHLFVLQSVPVKRALQVWEGARRTGSMLPGHLSVLPAGLPMTWQWTGPVQSLHVSVAADVADIFASGQPPLEIPAPFLLDDALARHFLEFLRMEAAVGADVLRCEQLVQRLLERVGVRRRRTRRRAMGGLAPHRFNAVADWVEANLAGQISVTDLAAVAGVETSWFTRLFTQTVGCPPYQYVLNRRVLRAQYALRAGMSPAAAATLCGFVDQAHLTRHFRRVVGHTPAAWARMARA